MGVLLHLIKYLKPMQSYNEVVREFKDPRFHKGANRVNRYLSRSVHPGRCFVRVIYPDARYNWPREMQHKAGRRWPEE